MDFMQRVMGQVGGGASLGVQKAAWDVHGAVPCFAEAFYFSEATAINHLGKIYKIIEMTSFTVLEARHPK